MQSDRHVVTIQGSGNNRCMVCYREKEGVQATFADGFTGFVCWNHLREMVTARSNNKDKDTSSKSAEGKV
jgi:hypothetical protein